MNDDLKKKKEKKREKKKNEKNLGGLRQIYSLAYQKFDFFSFFFIEN